MPKTAFDVRTGTGSQGLERAFASIAHNYIREAAPDLLPYEVGFQLIDKNEDGDRAVGVFAFVVGKELVYAPVFFLKGKLKGGELMYLKKPGIFLKLSNGWVDYVRNKREQLVGQPITQQDKQHVRRPDLYTLFNPNVKLAEEAKTFVEQVAPLTKQAFADTLAEYTKAVTAAVDIPKFLKRASAETLKNVCVLLESSPGIYNRFEQWYGMDTLADAVLQSERREKAAKEAALWDMPAVKQANSVQIFFDAAEVPLDATEPELSAFYNTGMLVRDNRTSDEKSKIVEMQMRELTQPSPAGYYDVMSVTGDMEKALIVPIRRFRQSSCPQPLRHVLVMDNRAQVFPTTELFVDNAHMGDAGFDFEKVFNDLPGEQVGKDKTLVAISKDAQASTPFEVIRNYGTDSDGCERYEIRLVGPEGWGTKLTLVHGGRIKLHYDRDTLRVPEDTKFFKYYDNDHCGSCVSGLLDDMIEEPKPLFVPANVNDVWRYQRQGAVAVKLAKTNSKWLLDGEQLASKKAAVNWLVHKYRLGADESFVIVDHLEKEAALRGSATEVLHIKLARSLVSDMSGIAGDVTTSRESQNLMGFRGELAPSDEVERLVPQQDVYGDRNAASASLFEDGMNQIKSYVQVAADRGDRDVFDVALLSSMLRTAKDELVIDEDLPSLIVALDKLGRLLFKFYWHMDMFEERYGKQDMPELEDMLRNAFDVLSDLILFLKNKTTDPFADGGEASFILN